MSALSVEERLAALETEVGQIKERLESPVIPAMPWWEKISGTFAQDPNIITEYEQQQSEDREDI